MQQRFLISIIISLVFLNGATFACNNSNYCDSIAALFLDHSSNKNTVSAIDSFAMSSVDSSFVKYKQIIKTRLDEMDKTEDNNQYAKYYYYVGYWYYENNDYVEAIKYLLTGLDFIDDEHKSYLKYRIYKQLADSYAQIDFYTGSVSFFSKAIDNYKWALDIMNDFTHNADENLSLHTSIANCYHGLKDTVNSEKHYRKAEQIAIESKNNMGIVQSLLNRGNVYFKYGRIDEGLKLTMEASYLAKNIDYKLGEAYCNLNLSQIYNRLKNYYLALEYANKTIHIAEQINSNHLKFRACQEKAMIYSRLGEDRKALNNYKKCLAYIENTSKYRNKKGIYYDLSRIYLKIKQFDKASYYQKQYINLSDSLHIVDHKKKIELAESIYQQESIIVKNKLLDKENKLKDIEIAHTRLFSMLIVILASLLVVLIVFQIRAKNKYKKQSFKIQEQNDIISKQNLAILEQNENLNAYKDNLEKVVNERTTDLKDTLNLVEESNQFKSAFLKNISHEIRTPLNAIVGFSHLIERQDNEKEKQRIGLIRKSSHELLNIVEKLIEVSEFETIHQQLQLETFSSEEFYNELKNHLLKIEEQNNNNDVAFKIELIDFNNLVTTDIKKLKRALSHVVENAMKFTSEGSISVTCVYTEKQLDFTIVDTGLGIDKEHLPFIFEPFKKLEKDDVLTRGVGIGLNIVGKIISIMKGRISVESELNSGTKVSISIPTTYN